MTSVDCSPASGKHRGVGGDRPELACVCNDVIMINSPFPTAGALFFHLHTLDNTHLTTANMPAQYPQRKIGTDSVSAQGLGCMGMSFAYTSKGGYNDEESLKVLTRAADLGITFWDTSDIYGQFMEASRECSRLTSKNRSTHQ